MMIYHGIFYWHLTVSLLFIVSSDSATLFGRLVRHPWLGNIGVTCYSMYLLHWYPTFWFRVNQEQFFNWLSLPNNGEIHFMVIFAITLSITFVSSVITYRLIELPAVQLGKVVIKWIWPDRSPADKTFKR